MGDMSYNINLEEKCQYATAKLFLQGSSFKQSLHKEDINIEIHSFICGKNRKCH